MAENPRFESIDGYRHISTVIKDTQERMDKVRSGVIKPLFTRSKKERDKIGGYYQSDQIVIAARTGTGKTAKVIQDLDDFSNIEINPYYAANSIILYDSYEMADWRSVLRMISSKGEVEAKDLLDYNRRLQEERYMGLRAIGERFKGYPVYISTRSLPVNRWEERKKQIQGQFPNKHIINIYDHTRLALKESEAREEELITNLMLAGMRLKNDFEMINIFVSQMNRNIETNVNRNQLGSNTPVSSDIFGSDGVFQCADIVIALHRPGMYKVEVFEGIPTGYKKDDPDAQDDLLIECILKQREGWTGNLFMKHNLAHNKIEDYDLRNIITYPDQPKPTQQTLQSNW
jgi:replicative DNA helicase